MPVEATRGEGRKDEKGGDRMRRKEECKGRRKEKEGRMQREEKGGEGRKDAKGGDRRRRKEGCKGRS